MTATPVEVTTRYATTVTGLAAAWQFVMSRIDAVGPDPRVEISPIWETHDPGVEPWERRFEVVVSGMVEEAG